MKKNINHIKIIAVAGLIAAGTLPALVFAQTAASITANTSAGLTAAGISAHVQATTTVKAGAGDKLDSKISNIVSRADQEITRRLTALNGLEARVTAMAKLSQAEKGDLSTNVQAQLSEMNALKAQIANDASVNNTTTLKADVQSITKFYRVFVLVLPQGSIEAASDRVLATANIMADLSTKLSVRIASSSITGANLSNAQSSLVDMNAKIADANAQANAAASEVAALKPDNGDATVMASNTTTLKDARSKVLAAQKDLVTARTDAQTIIKDLKINVSVSATSTVSAQ